MRLGELLSVAREMKGWSLRELAAKSGVHNALISQIETGHIKNPGWRTVAKLALALNLKLDRLAELETE